MDGPGQARTAQATDSAAAEYGFRPVTGPATSPAEPTDRPHRRDACQVPCSGDAPLTPAAGPLGHPKFSKAHPDRRELRRRFDFELSDDEQAAIDALDTGRRGGPEPSRHDACALRTASSPKRDPSGPPTLSMLQRGRSYARATSTTASPSSPALPPRGGRGRARPRFAWPLPVGSRRKAAPVRLEHRGAVLSPEVRRHGSIRADRRFLLGIGQGAIGHPGSDGFQLRREGNP